MKVGQIVLYDGFLGRVVKHKDGFKFLPDLESFDFDKLETITDEDIQEATHEEKLILIKIEFKWGEVVDIHCIGDYQIVEYVEKRTNKRLWHAYIDYNDTHASYTSLDSALVGCIGYKYEGANGKAAMYFEKMIDLK